MALQLADKVKRFMGFAERSGMLAELEAKAAAEVAAHRDALAQEKKQVVADYDQRQRVAVGKEKAAKDRLVAAEEALRAAKSGHVEAWAEAFGLSTQRDNKIARIEGELIACIHPMLQGLLLTIEQLGEGVRGQRFIPLKENHWMTSGPKTHIDNGNQERQSFIWTLLAARDATIAAMRGFASEACVKFAREQLQVISDAVPRDMGLDVEKLYADNVRAVAEA